MSKQPAPDEWDQLVVKMGTLTLAVGALEMAIIVMVCRILDQTEEEIGIYSNDRWCQKFNEVAPASWPDEQRKDLAKRLKKIRNLYIRRNRMIHTALGVVGDSSIAQASQRGASSICAHSVLASPRGKAIRGPLDSSASACTCVRSID